jgi:hypothetical protein
MHDPRPHRLQLFNRPLQLDETKPRKLIEA